ncbi:MAG: hypothetical protein HY318_18055 [Armatimonadetes bacterium]|nr:hypothetical protein [Armatimonadota bacterium]
MRHTVAWSGVGVLVAVLLVSSAMAQRAGDQGDAGQWGRPGGPASFDPKQMMAMGMAMGAVDAYWLTLTFDLKVPDAKLNNLRPKFQQAWDARKKAFDTAWGGHKPDALWSELKRVNSTLEGAIKSSLGAAQLKKLKESVERRAKPPWGGFGGPGKRKGGQEGRPR